MNGFRNLKIFSKFTAVGLAAWAGGMLSERYRQSKSDTEAIFDRFVVHAAKSFGGGDYHGKSSVVPFEDQSSTMDWEKSTIVTEKSARVSQIMRFGFPDLSNIITYDDFVISYDKRNRVPYWVFEHLTRENVKFNESVDRAKCDFFEEQSIHKFFRATNQDYKGSGYDRGHLAAAGNHRKCQEHMSQTFTLSNMSPQVGKGFNRDSWNRLEKYVRGLTKIYKNLYVCTGPLYLPKREQNGKLYVKYEVIGPNHVAVPTHFFKVVLGELDNGALELETYVMPNAPIGDDVPLTSFLVPLEAVEKGAGLLFFDKIDKKKLRYPNPDGRKRG